MSLALADAPAVAALALVFAAAFCDLARFEIPDSLSIGVGGLALVYGLLDPGFVWWGHLLAPALMFGFGLLAFARGWLGGGDVKLMTALAAWTGLYRLPILFLAVSLAGGVLALVLLLARRGAALAGVAGPRLLARDAPLPYAVAIATGTLWWAVATHFGPLG